MQKEKLLEHLKTIGKGNQSWYEIGSRFGVEGSTKQISDYTRKLAKKALKPLADIAVKESNNTDKLLSEFKEFLKEKYINVKLPKPYLTGDPKNVLVIPDTHIPFEIDRAIEFLADVKRKWNCGTIVHAGDLIDAAGSSFHPTDPNLPSAGYEFEIAKHKLVAWNKVFPNVTMTIGNHDRIVARKLFDASVSNHWVRDMAETYGIDWNIVPEFIFNNVLYIHGEGSTASQTALNKGISTVQGHRHSETYIKYIGNRLFGLQTPVLISRKEAAFNYAKADTRDYSVGCAVILNDQPIIELM